MNANNNLPIFSYFSYVHEHDKKLTKYANNRLKTIYC